MQKIFADVMAVLDIPSKTQTGFDISSLVRGSCAIREKGSFIFSCILKWTLIRSLFFAEITEITLCHFSDQ